MLNILVCIPNFGTGNRIHIKRVLTEFKSYTKYNLSIHLLLTDDFDTTEFAPLKIEKHLYPGHIGESLPHTHKQIFEQQLQNYDYFLYIEDDLLLKESLVDTFMEETKILPPHMVCGFLRYENKLGAEGHYLIDCHPDHAGHRGGKDKIIMHNYLINGIEYFELYNLHQGCYLLSRQQLSDVIKTGRYFLDFWRGGYAGILESAGSDVFFRCGIVKVIPRKKIQQLLLHHLPDKYVNRVPDVYRNHLTPTDTQLAILERGS